MKVWQLWVPVTWYSLHCLWLPMYTCTVHSYSHVLYLASDYQITLRVHVIWLNPFSLCRLLVNMTQPAVICFGKVPTEKMERNQFLEVMSHLQSYKEVLYSVFSLFNNWYKYYYKFTSLISVTSFFALLEIARLMANVGHVCLNFFCVSNAKLRSCNKGAFIIYLLIVVNWYQKITLYSMLKLKNIVWLTVIQPFYATRGVQCKLCFTCMLYITITVTLDTV